VPNPDKLLTPGMFANISIDIGEKQRYLTLPQTAIVYNPYGETVYVVTKRSEFDKAQAIAAVANNAAAKPEAAKDAKAKADEKKADDKKDAAKGGPGPDDLVVQQAFVTTGATRGDQVAITKGLDEGAEVVTSGQVKLKSGAAITIDNSVQPANAAAPTPQEH
jgi:membrane fusion protein (multidrug efflux system)